jgi:ABC-type transport system substrate-binding protein
MPPRRVFLALLAPALLLGSCGSRGGDERVAIAFIGEPGDLFETGLRLPPAGQEARAATAEGLVMFDAAGEVVPGLAERWIVTDDGLSYIFRLRDSEWPDGGEITGEEVRDALRRTVAQLRGTSLGLDLAPIANIRAMTGRVVEVDLATPMPDFLRVLAQPELGILHKGRGAGPMKLARDGMLGRFTPLPPETQGLPQDPRWKSRVRPLEARALPARKAIALFDDGAVDIVLGGDLASMPLVDTGPLSRGTVRLDAAQGLFGLVVRNPEGLLGEAARREAIAMAIDRSDLLAPFNIGGWVPTTRVVAPGLAGDPGTLGERWEGMSIEARRAEAARRLAGWRKPGGAELTVALPQGPGADLLLRQLNSDLAPVGVRLVRAAEGARPDLELIDRQARYGEPRWYLNQLSCALNKPLCAPKADQRVAEALAAPDPLQRAALLSEAEAELTATNMYIPLGAPVRWSLVRGNIDGFTENRWSLHPLFPLSLRPT